jgi:hypothetical protein
MGVSSKRRGAVAVHISKHLEVVTAEAVVKKREVDVTSSRPQNAVAAPLVASPK